MTFSVVILGCGTSHGVPVIACDCAVCRSDDPRNQRTRTSIIVRRDDRVLLIDTPPDLRTQALRNNIRRVDAVAFTHAHADHMFGLDDIRRFNEIQGSEITCYGHRQTLKVIREAFSYIFVRTQAGGGKPRLRLKLIEGPFEEAGLTVTPVPVYHGHVRVQGYRIGDFAYVTDVSRIPPDSMKLLQGLDTLVLGVLRFRPHPTHFNLEQGLAMVERLRPRRAIFTHLAHDLDYAATNAILPPGVELAYDGMELEMGG